MNLSELNNIFKVTFWTVFEWATYCFLYITTIKNPCDKGVGLEDPEDPGYLDDQGKQSFDHDWAYVILHASVANISVACDHKYR